MAATRLKTWDADEILTADDLNAEFDNLLVTSDQLIGTPRTAAWDMDGEELILDEDGNTSLTADTDDTIHIRIGGTDRGTLTATAFTWTGSFTADGQVSSNGNQLGATFNQVYGG